MNTLWQSFQDLGSSILGLSILDPDGKSHFYHKQYTVCKKVAKKLLTFFNSIYQLSVHYELLPNLWVKLRGFLRCFPQNLRS